MPVDLDSARVLKIMSYGKRVADCQLKSTSPYARKYDTVREPYDTVRATYEQRYEKRLRTPYEPRLRYRTNKGYEPKDEPPLQAARLWPSLCCCVLFTAAFLLQSLYPLPLLVVLAPFILSLYIYGDVLFSISIYPS